ncbi:11479_t:CDS:2, partial [Acaulospora colombiana]
MDFFTESRDWSLLNFLDFRQKEENWTVDKMREHNTYIRTLGMMERNKSSENQNIIVDAGQSTIDESSIEETNIEKIPIEADLKEFDSDVEEIGTLTEEEMNIRNNLLAVLTAQQKRDTQSGKDCLSSIYLNGILDFSDDE